MAKFKYIAVPNTAGNLFRRLANDEANNAPEFAQQLLEFVHDKISEQDYATLQKMLMGGEAGEEDVRSNGTEARAGAQDSASVNSFHKLFPSAKKIGRDPLYHYR